MDIVKFLTNNAKSLVSSELKGAAKKLIFKVRERSKEDLNKEVEATLGYLSTYFKVSKDQKITFAPSAAFFNEIILNCPEFKDRFLKDEETGKFYLDGTVLNNTRRTQILKQITTMTGIKNVGIGSYLEGALKLLDPVDYTAFKFKEVFAGWDPEAPSIIDGFLAGVYGKDFSEDDELSNFLFTKWMIGAARRAIEPGVPFDGCLLLKGKPAIGKTALFRNLLPNQFSNRIGEITCDVKNAQKFLENITGKTIVNFDELSVLDFPKSQETFKQLISSQFMDVRLAYGHKPIHYDLRQAFGGTTNHQQFIPDPFLSRRLWTISLKDTAKINFGYLAAHREALWQEAVYRAEQNEEYLLNVDEQKRLEASNLKHLKD